MTDHTNPIKWPKGEPTDEQIQAVWRAHSGFTVRSLEHAMALSRAVLALAAEPPSAMEPSDEQIDVLITAHGTGGWQTSNDMLIFARAVLALAAPAFTHAEVARIEADAVIRGALAAPAVPELVEKIAANVPVEELPALRLEVKRHVRGLVEKAIQFAYTNPDDTQGIRNVLGKVDDYLFGAGFEAALIGTETAAQSADAVSLASGAGFSALEYVIQQMHEHGRVVDEEGDMTNALEELHAALSQSAAAAKEAK